MLPANFFFSQSIDNGKKTVVERANTMIGRDARMLWRDLLIGSDAEMRSARFNTEVKFGGRFFEGLKVKIALLSSQVLGIFPNGRRCRPGKV